MLEVYSRASTQPGEGEPQIRTPSSTVPEVTQQELARLHELRLLNKETERLRKSLVERLVAGARVQPGRYSAELRKGESRRFSRSEMKRLLGEESIESLRAQLRPIITQTLYVTDSDSREC